MKVDKSDWKWWRVEYLPSSQRPGVREWVIEGTRADMDAWFLNTQVCELCKEEMKGGPQTDHIYLGSQYMGTETRDTEPYDNPWATPCGCEYSYEEVER